MRFFKSKLITESINADCTRVLLAKGEEAPAIVGWAEISKEDFDSLIIETSSNQLYMCAGVRYYGRL